MKTTSSLAMAATALLFTGALARAQITDQLVVHLPFDNAYTNSRNNGISGAAVGSPVFGPGKIGSAVSLTTLMDGTSFNYVTLGYPAELNFGSLRDNTAIDFSIAFWCNYTNQVDDPPFVSNKDWGSSNNRGWGIFTQGSGNSRINTTDDQGANGKQSTSSTPIVRDGTWHHVAVAWVRTNAVFVYVDGTLRTTSSLVPVTGPIDTGDLGYAVNIGQDGTGGYTDGGPPNGAQMVDVLMDDLGIWRRAISAGEVAAIYSAGLGGTNLANVPAIVNPYVSSTAPAAGETGVAPNLSPVTAVITDGLNAVAQNSISMRLNGALVNITTNKVGTATTVQGTPAGLLLSGLNTAVLRFANNSSPQRFFTNTWTFNVSPYVTVTPDLQVTPDTSKPGFKFNLFANSANQANSNARSEAAFAGLLTDGNGNALPNLADPTAQGIALAPAAPANPANAPISFEIPTVINLNATGGSGAGNFLNDDQMPGVPASDFSTDGTAAEILTYLELPAGLLTMGVNSDDGFRTAIGKPPQDRLKALIAGEFEGSRTAADTLFYVNVQQAGVYAFRTLWENGNAGSDMEWFTVTNGNKVLLNDVANGGIKAYRETTTTFGPYVKYIAPPPVPRQQNQPASSLVIVLADGSTAIDDNSVQLKLDGTTPSYSRVRSGTLVTLTYTPATIQFPEDQHEASLSFQNTGGSISNATTWMFCNLKNVVLPAPIIFESFDAETEGGVPIGWAQTNYTDCSGNFCTTPGLDLDDLESDTYKAWVVVDSGRLQGLKGRIFNGPAPNQMSNGVPVTLLASGNMLYAESDVRDGSQAQFLYSKAYNLATVNSAAIGFGCLYEQNQDNLGAVEYSVDGGHTWLPIVYYLDYADEGGDIRVATDGTVDAVATFTNPIDDTAFWTVNGVPKGGNYGDGIAAAINQGLGRFVAPRENDNSVEGKRFEIYRLPLAARQPDVRLRFAQIGTASWYFGFDNLGFYDVAPPVLPRMNPIQATSTTITISWIGAGTLLEAGSPSGPWTVSPTQGNPQTQPIGASQKFFRIGPP